MGTCILSVRQDTRVHCTSSSNSCPATTSHQPTDMDSFPALKNDLYLRAARNEKVEAAPAWIMRQAGRYLPEFKEVRAENNFFQVCRTPELACEVTMQPLRRYNGLLDASIIFSDILVVPQALGMEVEMRPGVGPVFLSPLKSPEEIDGLRSLEKALPQLQYVFDAITLTRKTIDGQVPLFGFTGAPWTLMAYMIEGGGSKTQAKSKKWLYTEKEASHKLLQLLTDVCVDYLVEQVKAGAQMLQVFESNAEHLGPDLFTEYCTPYLNQICDKVKAKLQAAGIEPVPMTVFAKGGGQHGLKSLASSNYEVLGIDWTMEPEEARAIVGEDKVLQGNLDPCALYAPPQELDAMVEKMVKRFGFKDNNKGWIVNLGHGIYPDIDPEHLKVFLESVKKHTSVQKNGTH